jgi:serine phosphatase RsbU (regulator of sigma subunit)
MWSTVRVIVNDRDARGPDSGTLADALRASLLGVTSSGQLWDALVNFAVTTICASSSLYVPVHGRLRLVATSHRDPFARIELGEMFEVDSHLVEQDWPHTHVLRTGQPWVAPDINSLREPVASSVSHAPRSGPRTVSGSAMALPVTSLDGVVAVWTFGDQQVGLLDDATVQMANELLSIVNPVLTQLVDEPITNSYVQTLARLQFFSAALVAATTIDEIATAFTALGLPAADAVAGSFSIVEGSTVRLASTRGLGQSVNDRWVTFDVKSVNPISEVLSAGRPFVAANRDEFLAAYPMLQADIDMVDHQAWIVLPLLRDNTVHAAVGFIWDRPIVVSAELRRKLFTVADLTSQAVHVVGLTSEAVQLSEALQQSMFQHDLPPSVDGLALGALYQPALDHARAGGDWYDVVVTGHDHVLLVLGDVTGSGAAAAAQMGRIRAMVQVLGFEGHEPARIAELTSAALQRLNAPVFATCVIARYSPKTGALTWTNAGHPFPVLLQPGRAGELLAGTHGPPLNAVDDAKYQQDTVYLPGGCRLVIASDGVIERAGEIIDVGMQRLVDVVTASQSVAIDRLPHYLVHELHSRTDRTDDVAILAVQTIAIPDDDSD